jgi:hypothetical protein
MDLDQLINLPHMTVKTEELQESYALYTSQIYNQTLGPVISEYVEPLHQMVNDTSYELVMDKHGLLYKRYIEYNGLPTNNVINSFNDWVDKRLKDQIESTKINLSNGDIASFHFRGLHKPQFRMGDMTEALYPNKWAIST